MENKYQKNTPTKDKRTYIISITIIGLFFFIFGFVTWLNGILIPYLKIACELTNFQALFVTFAFYISYTVMALPSSWILKKTGFKNGMMVGLFVMAIGTAMFIPAAQTRVYELFLLGLFILGTGLALLQTASNPYVTIIGPRESAAKRISIMGICNKVAGAIAPLILAYFILNDGDTFVANLGNLDAAAKVIALDGLAERVILPYLVMTIVLVLLGIMIRFAPLPEIEEEQDENVNDVVGKTNIFQFPNLVLGVLALFFYVGAEVIAGDTIISYGRSLGIPLDTAKIFTSLTLASMIVGYVIGIILIPKYLSQEKALAISAILGILFSIIVVLTPPMISVTFVALLGLANAIVWPAIWPLALHGLNKFIKTGSAMLIMAIAGGAILPLAWGMIADDFSSQLAYIVMIPLYLFIYFYAAKWHKLSAWK
ncbi:MAG: sugar MFS transporter [Bacteroidales bacterium]|jgi:MFS transporter, FHS family, L-fucose permease|nr:glucose/galactose MFS transporter [Lentimicrobiaceae bacterium]MDG1136597.1 sugar MFS transporter [Bacteroidales bacterium]MDG1901196.1 sugar MFS transporter [Bacteroidales bacterium]MDG2080328.1 sugar MFS transporter [Bacteroidales bacterium]|tara:strand:- start:8505 stop:9785 length:1281 start_codon:yes stop_codon:yes gene_type:complete